MGVGAARRHAARLVTL